MLAAYRKCLIIVDVQIDFLPGGSLAVQGGDHIIEPIEELAKSMDMVIATRDFHPINHCSFKENGGEWPVHCVKNTVGSMISTFINPLCQVIVSKGMDPKKEAYSGFDGTALAPLVSHYFGSNDEFYIVGLATDYCVKATAIDALHHCKNVFVPVSCVRGVDIRTTDEAFQEMELAGVKIIA